jgi:hypothetical protein
MLNFLAAISRETSFELFPLIPLALIPLLVWAVWELEKRKREWLSHRHRASLRQPPQRPR